MAKHDKVAIWTDLEPTSFRGVPWYVQSISVKGGRKVIPRPIINSSNQVVNDIGLQQRGYVVRGYVVARYKTALETSLDALASGDEVSATFGDDRGIKTDYRQERKDIIKSFEDAGPGIFIHPIEGAIEGLSVKEFSIDEAITEVGIGRITVKFVRETTKALPKPKEGGDSKVSSDADLLDDGVLTELEAAWTVSGALIGSVQSAVEKVTDFYEGVTDIVETVAAVAEELDKITRQISQFTADLTSQISDAVAIADSVKGLVASMNSVFPSAIAAFQNLQNGFDFGDLDLKIEFNSPAGQAKRKSNAAFNTAVQTMHLTSCYVAATDLVYVTDEDINIVEGIVDAQHQKLVEGDEATDEVKALLENVRLSFFNFLAGKRQTALKIVDEEIPTVTPRVLSYLLYEDADSETVLFQLNGVRSYELLSGTAKVLSA